MQMPDIQPFTPPQLRIDDWGKHACNPLKTHKTLRHPHTSAGALRHV